jgi:hypothetical protein
MTAPEPWRGQIACLERILAVTGTPTVRGRFALETPPDAAFAPRQDDRGAVNYRVGRRPAESRRRQSPPHSADTIPSAPRSAGPCNVVIELDNVEELFAADPGGLLAGGRRIDSGMDELVQRFLAQKEIAANQRVVLDIASACSDELATKLVAAVRRYCELRMCRANREHDLIWRQGMRSLVTDPKPQQLAIDVDIAARAAIMAAHADL